jgi:hypothetical protein
MQFESSQTRNFWINAFLGLIPDFVIAVAVAYFTGSGILGFILTVVGFQCLYFAIWLKNTIWRWTFFKFRGKRLMIEHIENWLKVSKFPAPNEYEISAEGYLNSLVENEELEPIIRMRAAGEMGVMNYLVANHNIQQRVMSNIAYEEAISNYKKHLERQGSERI